MKREMEALRTQGAEPDAALRKKLERLAVLEAKEQERARQKKKKVCLRKTAVGCLGYV